MYHRSDKKDEQSSVTSNLYQSGNTRDGSCRISDNSRALYLGRWAEL